MKELIKDSAVIMLGVLISIIIMLVLFVGGITVKTIDTIEEVIKGETK